MLRKGARSQSSDAITPDEEIKDPYVLEFLGLNDEYSETEIEAALIGKLQAFLLELGGHFTFVGRQHRLRVGDEWYRVDLLLFHRRLRCQLRTRHRDAPRARQRPPARTLKSLPRRGHG